MAGHPHDLAPDAWRTCGGGRRKDACTQSASARSSAARAHPGIGHQVGRPSSETDWGFDRDDQRANRDEGQLTLDSPGGLPTDQGLDFLYGDPIHIAGDRVLEA